MIKSTFYITPSEYDAQHHGVLGMKWGVRRYQSYDTVPRKSGKGGEEHISAKDIVKADKKLKAYSKVNRYSIKAAKYATKGYKKSIKLGNADGNDNSYMDKSKKYFNKAKKVKLKGGVSYMDLAISSPKVRSNYEKYLRKYREAESKCINMKLTYKEKYLNSYKSRLVEFA